MKKILFIISCFVCLFFASSNAQFSSNINLFGHDSSNVYCGAPATVSFFLSVNTTGYMVGDVITFQIAYGDGSTDVTTNVLTPNFFTSTFFQHVYNAPGYYTVEMIATGPDGNADTIIDPNMIYIANSCDTIHGKVYNDLNSNCTYNSGELGVAGMIVTAYNLGGFVQNTVTNASGDYTFYLPTGTNYELHLHNAPLADFCPNGGIETNAQTGNTYDFGFDCSTASYDLGGNMYGWAFRPGLTSGTISLNNLKHFCTDDPNPSIVLDIDPLVSFASATITPDVITTNQLTWNFSSFSAIPNNISVNFLTSLSAQIGDSVCFTYHINPVSGDANPTDNTIHRCYPVVNSYDPNMKEVSPAGLGSQGLISANQTMEYTVHFQNTGNDVAYHVSILDTIDADLDMATFRLISATHQVNVIMLPGNVLKFDFPNINLADSVSNEPESHGSFIYTIDQMSNLSEGTTLENTAYIYFDFNPPIVTNTTLNTITYNLSTTAVVTQELNLYPVPATDIIYIGFPVAGNWNVFVTDALGRNIRAVTMYGTTGQLLLNDFPRGMYYLKAISGDTEINRAFIKQ